MNPHQKNKIDVSVRCSPDPTLKPLLTKQSPLPYAHPIKLPFLLLLPALPPTNPPSSLMTKTPSFPRFQTLSPEEQRLFRLYGKLPSQASVFARNNQRKYFDSGDYALNKAGKGDGVDTGNVGSIVPDVDTIRHNSPAATNPANAGGVGGTGPGGSSITTPGLNKSGSISGPSSGIPVGSPAKESSLQRETSAEEAAMGDDDEDKENVAGENGAAGQSQAIPIRT